MASALPAALTFEETLVRELEAQNPHQNESHDPPSHSNVIVISGLSPGVTIADLNRLFAHQEPQLVSIDLVNDPVTGRSAGYANITLESPEAAEQALDVLGGEGSRVLVGVHGTAVVRYSQTATPNDLDHFNLYIGNLGPEVTERAIIEYLTALWEEYIPPPNCTEVLKLGPVTIRLPRDPMTKKPMSFCFIKFEYLNVPQVLLQLADTKTAAMEMAELCGTIPVLRELKPRPPMTIEGEQPLSKREAPMWSNTTICAMGLPDDVTEKDLRKHFGQFGEIASVKVAVMKHLALIRFRQNVCALAAMTQLEGETFRDRIIRLFWARSKNPILTKDQTQAMAESERATVDKAEAMAWAKAMKPLEDTSEEPKRKKPKQAEPSEEDKARWAAELAADLGCAGRVPLMVTAPPPPPPPP